MCGIAGYFGPPKFDSERARKGLATMERRGPDGQQFCIFKEKNGAQVALLHSRLAIIDLNSRSDQPFTLGNHTIVFNGEIYNYIELRDELQREGVTFTTNSDTEVLLQAYICWGEACLARFEGMWAFCIYDQEKHSLFLARDRFGEKPLYYAESEEGFFFASQTNTLRALCERSFDVNIPHVVRYLVNGYKSLYKEPDTFYQGIHELKYASSLVVSDSLKPKIHRYWVPTYRPNSSLTQEDCVAGVRHHLIESMRLRLRSDVPLAFCLSGGVDSASLVSIAAKKFNYRVETFSIIEDDERYNEYDNIMATVRDVDCPHHLIRLNKSNSIRELQALVEYHDAPVATTTYFVHSLLSRSISEKKFRVAFSGTSADELFTGYYDHFNMHLYEMRNHPRFSEVMSDWQRYTGTFVRNPFLKDPELFLRDTSFRDHIYLDSKEFKSYLRVPFEEGFKEERFTDSLLRNRMLNELFHESTPVILHEDDLNSMFYSIENRSPFLDSRLFEFAYTIPPEYLIQNGYGKYILREAMKGILNDQVRLDRKKKGFNASVDSFIDFSDENTLEYLLDPSARIYEIVDRDAISKLLRSHPSDNSYSKFLFSFINARIFLK